MAFPTFPNLASCYLILLSIHTLYLGSTDAIQCFSCTGRIGDCEGRESSTDCGHQPYCFLQQDAKSGNSVQRCTGDPTDCGTIVDFIQPIPVQQACCVTNNCNCVGRQCRSPVIGHALSRDHVARPGWAGDSREIMRQPGVFIQTPNGVRPLPFGPREPLGGMGGGMGGMSGMGGGMMPPPPPPSMVGMRSMGGSGMLAGRSSSVFTSSAVQPGMVPGAIEVVPAQPLMTGEAIDRPIVSTAYY